MNRTNERSGRRDCNLGCSGCSGCAARGLCLAGALDSAAGATTSGLMASLMSGPTSSPVNGSVSSQVSGPASGRTERAASDAVRARSGIRSLRPATKADRHVEGKTLLYRAGQPCDVLYVVRSAVVITSTVDGFGRAQVVGYHNVGDLVGVDGVAMGTHTCDAVIARAGDICALPIEKLTTLAAAAPELQQGLVRRLREAGILESAGRFLRVRDREALYGLGVTS